MKEEVKSLAIDLIVLDKELQGREEINNDHVADLRTAWRETPESVPALKVFFDGSHYWLADGFHRYHAGKEEKRGSLPCVIFQGSKRAAWIEALRSNQGHGLRRTNADKRRLVTMALNDKELVEWSDHRIAEHIGVGNSFVSNVRNELSTVDSSPAAEAADKPKVGKDGKKRKPRKQKKPKSEAGSQGGGGAAVEGPCPHGGEHDYDDEACKRCHDPKPGISGGVTFNVEELTGESNDAFGEQVPDDLRQVFELCEEFDDQRKKLTAIKSWITQRLNHPGAKWLEAAAQRIRSDIDNADSELKFAKPYCVCVYCLNKPPKVANCNACKGFGWITEPVYKQAPKGMKRDKVRS